MAPATPGNSRVGGAAVPTLLVEAAGRLVALPLEGGVEEVMRPRPVSPVPDAPPGVVGMASLRGGAVPVVRLGDLLGGPSGPPGRFVLLRVGGRRVALEVEGVRGVRTLAAEPLPALLAGAEDNPLEALARVDREFALWLGTARLVPPEGPP